MLLCKHFKMLRAGAGVQRQRESRHEQMQAVLVPPVVQSPTRSAPNVGTNACAEGSSRGLPMAPVASGWVVSTMNGTA